MYEAKERQKFINNAQYLREMQHKMDSDYQVGRLIHCTSSDEASGCELKSTVKCVGNKTEAKFPAINKASVKQKQKPAFGRKSEKNGFCPKKDTPGEYRRINYYQLFSNSQGKYILKAVFVLNTDPQDVTGQRSGPAVKNKKKYQERKNLVQSSKLSIDRKILNNEITKGNVLTSAEQSPTNPVNPAVQDANGPSVSSELNSSNLPPIKNTLTRPKNDDLCTLLYSNLDSSTGENEDVKDVNCFDEELSVDPSKPPLLDQNNRMPGMSLAQVEQQNCEVGIGSDGRRNEPSRRLLWQYNIAGDPTAEQPFSGQRKPRDQRKPYALEESLLEEAHKNEGENLTFSARSPHTESRPGSATADEAAHNLRSTEDWAGSKVCDRERQCFENNQRCYAGLVSSARATVQRPSVHSPFNIPNSLIQPANRTEAASSDAVAAASVQVTELNGSRRFTARRQLSPIRIRDSFSATQICQSSSPTISTFEDSSFLEDSISNGPSSISPSTTSHDEDNFLNSHSSSSSTESSHPSLFQANFTAHLHMTGPLPDQVPIFLTVSDLRNQNDFVSSTTACSSLNAKEINKPEIDPEKLKKLQESLLAEDSEEEGDQCRICQIPGGSVANPLLEPCGCGGTLRFVHQECLKTWLKAKIKSGAELGAVKTCELCKRSLTIDLDDFNVNDYYRNHQQSRAQDELMNSGLYLVLLLHLYEQRFAELMRLNYNQASRDRVRGRKLFLSYYLYKKPGVVSHSLFSSLSSLVF
uniref:RING-type E3 ubiquitin transferase n=1 Tax=Varanus komodoensis TaxID=61221 RepID=A0A8D2Q7G4_VARKO